MKHVLILGAQVPFVRGGAEFLNESLVSEINRLDGFRAELVLLPFKWYPESQILNDILSWRFLDLSESNGMKIDLVISTKFPSYCAEHKNKILWLVHQHRVFYDLENTEFDHFRNTLESKTVRKKVRMLDSKFIRECKKIYTISKTVTNRLGLYHGIESTPLYPPSAMTSKIYSNGYNDRIVYFGRIDPIKRIHLLLHALEYVKNAKATIIGGGVKKYETELKEMIQNKNLSERCDFLGYLSEEDLLDHLSRARAIIYTPYNEDFGYATIEAFLARKPVITCDDCGEVTTLVARTGSGLISSNDPKEIGDNIKKIYEMNESELENCASEGYEFSKSITWERVIKKLVLENI